MQHLYIFAGYPKNGLHAGGIRLFTQLEEIGVLEEDSAVQYRKEGVYIGGEWSRPIEYHMSALCERDGLGWQWFPENWGFGNGVTVHKTTAEYQKHIVILEDNTIEVKVDDRSVYEARWAEGKCPQESHVVHLTWCVFQHELPDFAYERLRAVIEDGIAPLDPEAYEAVNEPGEYKSAHRTLTFGKEKQHAIPSL